MSFAPLNPTKRPLRFEAPSLLRLEGIRSFTGIWRILNNDSIFTLESIFEKLTGHFISITQPSAEPYLADFLDMIVSLKGAVRFINYAFGHFRLELLDEDPFDRLYLYSKNGWPDKAMNAG